MRIFFPDARIPYPPHDGPHVHVYQLTRHLVARGHEVITLEPDRNPVTTVWPRSARSVWRALRRADVVYCRPKERPTMAARLAGLPWRLAIPRTSAVVWEQNRALSVSLHVRRRTPAEIATDIVTFRRLARRVDAAIGVAPQVSDELRELLGIGHVRTIQNGSDPVMFDPARQPPAGLDARDGHLQVVWIGSHSNSIHNAPLIEGAATLAAARALPIQFHILGKTRALFSASPPANMTFHGPVDYEELPSYLAAMHVGLAIYNTRVDGGSPLKLFDYMASGCVPLCSMSTPMRDVIGASGIGYMEEWNAESLCLRLDELQRNAAQRQQMGARARSRIQERYTWAHVAEEVEQVLEEALRRRRSPRGVPATPLEPPDHAGVA